MYTIGMNNKLRANFISTDALMDYSNGELLVTGENATANIFASYPAKHLSVLNGFFDQVREHVLSRLCIFLKVLCAFVCTLYHTHMSESLAILTHFFL